MKINSEKIVLYVIIVALAIGASVLVFGKSQPQSVANEIQNTIPSETLVPDQKKTTFKKYNEVVNPKGFVNTDNKSISIGEFIGKKVVLIDFVTYSCINCQRTFPYIASWHEKYNDKGLQIIAIHTPEFAFEHKKENVEKAFKEFGLKFPAVLDNDYSTWNAWGNNYWPRKYIIDIDGYVVYDHIGEGKYEETETKIIDLLNERNTRLGQPKIEGGSLTKNTEKNILNIAISPETYLGSQRADKQYGKALMCESGSCSYGQPIDIPNDKFSLSGKWKQLFENIGLVEAPGSLFYNYNAGKVHLVADADTPVTAQVFIDGDIIDSSIAGSDVKNGQVTFSESRLYNLVDSKNIESHVLELRFEKPGVRGYAFTFGQ
jgi:thiol-disulfide isomerase/thioredoxin